MATTRSATTVWHGSLLEGSGASSSSRPDSAASTSPGRRGPRILPGARARRSSSAPPTRRASRWPCRAALAKAGTPPDTLETTADVTFQPGEGITGIHLTVRGEVPGMTADAFAAAAEAAKTGCPVSQALTGTTITLTATLA